MLFESNRHVGDLPWFLGGRPPFMHQEETAVFLVLPDSYAVEFFPRRRRFRRLTGWGYFHNLRVSLDPSFARHPITRQTTPNDWTPCRYPNEHCSKAISQRSTE
jgi:hypothetical protein